MNQDDKNSEDSPSGPERETQQSFDQGSHNDNPRRLEPVFEDIGPLVTSEESRDRLFEEPGHDANYDDDTIDYDIEPGHSLSDDIEDFDAETPADYDAPWQDADSKPELERRPESVLAQGEGSRGSQDDALYYDADDSERANSPWPLSLIVVAGFAVLLVGAGGYGVMQQRTEMQEEIRSLQASIATSANPEELVANREAQHALSEQNAELSATIESLQLEIRSLKDTATGLESQLDALRSDPASEAVETAADTVKSDLPPAKASVKPVAVKPVAVKPVAVKPVAVKPATTGPTATEPVTTGGGDWFVNFGSYRKKDTATSWANRLDSSAGQVVVVTGINAGETFYRVRVVGLATRQQAEGIARTLEREHLLSKLWVGRQ